MAIKKVRIVCSCSTAQQVAKHRHTAKIRITRNSAWIRLEIDKHNSILILIDTGASISIIREDVVELWKKTELNQHDLYKRTPRGRTMRWIPTGHHRQSNHLPLPPIRRTPDTSIILHSPQSILQSHTRTPRDDQSRSIPAPWTPTHHGIRGGWCLQFLF